MYYKLMVKYFNSEQECFANLKGPILEKKGNTLLYKNEPVKSFVNFEETPALIKSIKACIGKDNMYSYRISSSAEFLKKVEFDTSNIDIIELIINNHLIYTWDSFDSSTDFCFDGMGVKLFSHEITSVFYKVKYKKIDDIVPDIKAHYVYYNNDDRNLLIKSDIANSVLNNGFELSFVSKNLIPNKCLELLPELGKDNLYILYNQRCDNDTLHSIVILGCDKQQIEIELVIGGKTVEKKTFDSTDKVVYHPNQVEDVNYGIPLDLFSYHSVDLKIKGLPKSAIVKANFRDRNDSLRSLLPIYGNLTINTGMLVDFKEL